VSPGDEIDAMLRGPEKIIAAFCPTCGGWTMFCTSHSDNARQWIQSCYVQGDLIMVVRSADPMGPACPQYWTGTEACPEDPHVTADDVC
jgi:hypothetical protein